MPQLSFHTPLGALTISQEDGAIVALDWGWGRDQTETSMLLQARDEVQEYFDGERTRFDLPLAPAGTTYRKRVWTALQAIPYAQTRTYLSIAGSAGGAARSVGQASGNNPLPILIPCHRVVAAHGLGGYSGGDGLETKRFLLEHEARILSRARAFALTGDPQ